MNSTGVKILIIFLLLPVLPLRAQSSFANRYLVRHLDMEQGLPCSYVDDVLVDHAGFLWIATSGGGLCRYDGYDFLTFNASSQPSLGSPFVRNLLEDRFGRLWVGSEGGLDVLDLTTLEKLDLGLSFNPASRLCSYLTEDAEGCIWTKFGDTLYRIAFDGQGAPQEVLSFTHPLLDEVNHVFEDVDGDGSVWTRLDGGLYKIRLSGTGSLEAVRVVPGLDVGAGTYVADFLPSSFGIWVATEHGLFRIDRSSGEWKQYVSVPENDRSLTQNFVSSLVMTHDGTLLVSTLHGLNVYNPVADNFERVGADIINCIKEGKDHLLVATENKGLLLGCNKTLFVKNISHENGQPGSLAAGAVNAIFQEAGGRLWVGAVEGGLSVLQPGGEVFQHLTREKGGLAHNSVSALELGPDMFVGTWGNGIDIVSVGPSPKRLGHLQDPDHLLDYVGALTYDSARQTLWIGSNRGVFLYDLRTGKYNPALEESATGCIGSCIDRRRQLWMGGLEGLFVFDLESRREDGTYPYVHYRYKLDQPESGIEEKISCVLEASEDEIYVGSNGGGVYRGRRQADGTYQFVCYSMQQGLSSDRVRGLCRDATGRIWISTEYGLNLLNPNTGIITPFLQKDGLQNVQFHWNNAFMGWDGLLYFGHAQGYSVVDPSLTPMVTGERGPLRFTRVVAGTRVHRNPFLPYLQMHEKDRSLLLQFSVLMPAAFSDVNYKYRLEDYDSEWEVLPIGRREVSYSSLPVGRYVFKVQAFNRFGEEIGALSLPVRVKPFFYHTWWFSLLIFLVAVALVVLLVRLRTRSLKLRQQMLEKTVEERTREISAQKKLVEEKADELRRQNDVLLHQNEELASRKILSLSQEDPFKEKVLESLQGLYKDPNLDVAVFCQAMGMSKTLLNTRLQEAFGLSIGQIIRTYRLTLAREMLESGSGLTVAEVAYEVGFNDPKYFTRCFTKEFGITPSEAGKA